MMAGAVLVAMTGIAAGVETTKAETDARPNNDRALHRTIPVATLRPMRYPLPDRTSVAVVTDDLVNGDDGGAAGSVAYDTGLTLAFGLGIGGSCKTKNSGCSEDGEECFHECVELVSALSDVPASRLFSPHENIFHLLL